MLADLQNVISRLTDIGLEIIAGKCELTIPNHAQLDDCQLTEAIFTVVLPDIKIVLINDCTLLGAPIFPRLSPKAIIEKHDDLIRMAGRLEQIDPYKAFGLLKNCFTLPKLLYILRASPSYLNGAQLGAFDCTVCKTISKISNVAFNDSAWM